MEKEIFISELEKIASRYSIRIVLAEKMGKRWSYLVGAGEELLLPSKLIRKFGNYAIFVEGELENEEKVADEIQVLFESTHS